MTTETTNGTISTLEPLTRLTRDLRLAAITLSPDEARFLVDNYYTMQKQRIRAAGQCRALGESGELHDVLNWYMGQSDALERGVLGALNAYAKSKPLGQWALSICGVGPVITAGLLAHIDCTVPTVGHVWSFAGLNPEQKWYKGQKRPFNAALKTLCWKIGESFVKQKARESDVYGKLYAERREYEAKRNDAGELADQAAAILKRTPKHAQRKTYAEGKLPEGHLHMRAKRWVVKIFLSHYHAVGHWIETGRMPPKSYAVAHMCHAHEIAPPNMDLIDGLSKAWKEQTDVMSHLAR